MPPRSSARRSAQSTLALAVLTGLSSTACPGRAIVIASVDAGPPPAAAFTAPEPHLRRLTRTQYQNVLRDTFGDAIVLPRALEPDTAVEGSVSVGAAITSNSPRGVEQYQTAAYDIAQQVLRDPSHRTPLLDCTPAGLDDRACAERFVRAAGRALLRRPVTTSEVSEITTVAMTAAMTLGDFHRGLEYALAALLQATDFLFRSELGEPDPTRPAGFRFTAYEFASRLSFFLWDGAPDDALLDAAADGTLDRPDGVAAQVDRMLASPRARRGLAAFVADWLQLARLDQLSVDTQLFPSYAPDLGPSAREEVLRTADWLVFDRDVDLRELATTRERFVNRRLAALYSVQFPLRDAAPDVFAMVTMPETSTRRGLITSAAILAMNSHPTSTSPTLRGKYIRGTLLCESILSPPAGLNTAIPEPSATARTLRERLAVHATSEGCRSCHVLMDPLGLGLEHFDAIGRYRTVDNGAPIDASGRYEQITFSDEVALAQGIHDHPGFPRCMVTRAYRYAQGRVETEGDRAELARLQDYFAYRGYRFRALLAEIATSPSFRQTAVVTPGGM